MTTRCPNTPGGTGAVLCCRGAGHTGDDCLHISTLLARNALHTTVVRQGGHLVRCSKGLAADVADGTVQP